ncbi:putative holin-like toxin [Veillonella agrestimuris]|nr:putative holin-like toxin [Veillonella agrestimuris]
MIRVHTPSFTKGGDAMSTYEALMLMIAFGTLVAIILNG